MRVRARTRRDHEDVEIPDHVWKPVPALSSLPIVAALDRVEAPPDAVVAPVVVLSLVEALSMVPDPRKPRGVRYDVLAVLLLGACAVLAGARSAA